jgi:hypothetical protein
LGHGDLTTVYNGRSIYMPASPNVSPSSFRGPHSFSYPQNSGNPTTYQGHHLDWQHSLRPSSPHVTRQYTYNTPQIVVQPAQISALERNRLPQEHPSSPQSAASCYSNDMSIRPTNSYPVSPESENSSSMRAPPDPTSSPVMTTPSPSSLVSPTGCRGPSLKKERIIKKNEKGHYICDFIGCTSEQKSFVRKCEWR